MNVAPAVTTCQQRRANEMICFCETLWLNHIFCDIYEHLLIDVNPNWYSLRNFLN